MATTSIRTTDRPQRAVTLLELLCVVAVMGLLSAVLLPSLVLVQRAAANARTRIRLAEWSTALEAFRTEYGYYPTLDASGLVNGGVTAATHPFHDVLAGRQRDGSQLAADSVAARENTKRMRFATFASAAVSAEGLLLDGSGNTEIAVLVDRNLDGLIQEGTDFTTWPAPGGLRPSAEEFPASGLRTGVAFYAPAANSGATARELICSWR